MKSILLTSTALVAFAGAAAAEITWSGDAEIGYNDDYKGGFYWDIGATLKGEQELSGGLVAGFKLDIDINEAEEVDAGPDNVYGTADDVFGISTKGTFSNIDIKASDYELYLKSDTAGLYFGDTSTASEELWFGVTNMDADSFAEGGDADEDAQIRGEVMMGGLKAAVSYHVFLANDTVNDDLVGMQLAATYEAGAYTLGFAYQDEDNPNGQIFGLSAKTSMGGADITASYAKEEIDNVSSLGVEVSYPFGPVTGTVFYVVQDSDSGIDDNYGFKLAYENGPAAVDFWYHDGNDEEMGIEGSYDMGNGLVMKAGYIDEGDDVAGDSYASYYIAGEYDMGNGAQLLLSYADVDDEAAATADGFDFDEIGDPEYYQGTTIAVSFEF